MNVYSLNYVTVLKQFRVTGLLVKVYYNYDMLSIFPLYFGLSKLVQ